MAIFVADEQDRPVDPEDLVALTRHVLTDRRVPPDMEVSVLLVDEDTISALNEHHMGHAGPTDVLAFPIDAPGESPVAGPAVLGDVVVCPAVAARQADEHRRPVERELRMLVVHGLLHLLGMDHADPGEEHEMFALTEWLLDTYEAAP